jgi:hypothetical protein
MALNKWLITALTVLSDFVQNVNKWKLFRIAQFLYGLVVHHTFSCYPGSGCSDAEESPGYDPFWFSLETNLASDVNTMEGGLPLADSHLFSVI